MSLQSKQPAPQAQADRLNDVLETIVRFSAKDFGARATMAYDGSEIDAIVLGINMLGEELAILSADLEARTEAAFSLALIGQITAGIGHEINTPLSVILNELETLSGLFADSNVNDATKARAAKALDRQRRSVESIRVISHNLRCLARKRSDLEFVQVNFSELLSETLGLVESIARKSCVKVIFSSRLSSPQMFFSDPGLLQQIILNISKNAIDAMESTEEKKLKVFLDSTPTGIRLTITDTGSGIPDHIVASIFQPFITTKSFGKGTGLGLSLVKKYAEIVGGTVSFQRHSNGTSFYFDLPYSAKTTSSTGIDSEAGTDVQETQVVEFVSTGELSHNSSAQDIILIVEDDHDLAEIVSEIVCRFGYQTEVAHNGSEALQKLTSNQSRYELVMNGIELAREWLKLPLPRPGFIILTGGSVIPSEIERQVPIYYKPANHELIATILSENISEKVLKKNFCAGA